MLYVISLVQSNDCVLLHLALSSVHLFAAGETKLLPITLPASLLATIMHRPVLRLFEGLFFSGLALRLLQCSIEAYTLS